MGSASNVYDTEDRFIVTFIFISQFNVMYYSNTVFSGTHVYHINYGSNLNYCGSHIKLCFIAVYQILCN